MTRLTTLLIAMVFAVWPAGVRAAGSVPPDFAKDVAPIFAKYCAGCHNPDEREGELSLESFADLQQGGGRGAVMIPGRADASLLIRALTGEVEPSMPPEDNERPTEAEIAVLRAWIDAGAKGPDGAETAYPELSTPEIAPAANVKQYVTSLAIAPDGKRLAIGRYRHVDLIDPATRQVLATTAELPGKVNSIAYSADGSVFVAASGVPGLYGVATICWAADGATQSQIKGHRDALYDAQLSPDGRLLATCSYDRQIHLWDVAGGKLVRTLAGHNGAVFELAFSADGSTLASASADATVKIWKVATGDRLDTLGQPEGEQGAVAFSPDDKWIVAGGADGQLRMWQFLSREQAQINPLKFSSTASESSIVKIAFSPDGSRLVSASEGNDLMLWDTSALTPLHPYEPQPDLVTGIAFEPDGSGFYVARIDGSWQRYSVPTGGESVANDDEGRGAVASATTAVDESTRLEQAEQEPNDSPAAANPIAAHAVVKGVIAAAKEDGAPDFDMFRFHAHKGQQFVLEINAARQKSPLDSRLEVLDAAGNPIPRVLLQAVRESYFTFRGQDSKTLSDFRLHRQQDMELNEFLYANGEVVKLWMYPRGPDSGFLVYPGIDSSRYSYFGTTAIAHALNQPCYVVQPHPPGTKLIPNGLPEYTLYYENDDDGWRKLGADSRVTFTATADGEYLVRVADVCDQGGDAYHYELIVRAPRPDFQIKANAADLSISAGSGKEFSVVAERSDDFDGAILVNVEGLPPGFHVSTPLRIQAGQSTAYGTLTADADAPVLTAENSKLAKLVASAVVNGQQVVKEPVSIGELKLAERPKVLVHIVATDSASLAAAATDRQPVELVIAPGETISAIVKVERNGFDGQISFGNEHSGRNLPHGVYVDNIGLNGLTLLQGENERKFFITAAKGVPETTRPFHLRSDAEGNQTSWPVIIRVQKRAGASESLPDRVADAPSAN
ncbi:MAG: c-type cytochrome domain-containing protein [Pirellulales bacterium]